MRFVSVLLKVKVNEVMLSCTVFLYGDPGFSFLRSNQFSALPTECVVFLSFQWI